MEFLSEELTWIIVASLTALLSAVYSFQSNRIARKALQLALLDHEDRQASFGLYLIDGYRWNQETSKKKFLFFHCTITNKSNSKNSYKATLEIEFVKTDDSVARVIVDHHPSIAESIPQKLSVFPVDIRMEEQVIESKWLLFEQPAFPSGNVRIDRLLIKLTDTNGNSTSAESFIVKDFIHEAN